MLLATLAVAATGPAGTPAPPRLGTLSIESATGLCTITLDDDRQVDLPLPGLDGPARGMLQHVAPGRHRIRVASFHTWYEGTVDVGAGELLEIRVEPRQFRVTSRAGC